MDVTIYEVLVFGMLKFSNLCEEMSNHTSQHLLMHSFHLIRFSSEFLPKTLSLIKYLSSQAAITRHIPSPLWWPPGPSLPLHSPLAYPQDLTLPHCCVLIQSDRFLLELEMREVREVPDAPSLNRSVDCSASPASEPTPPELLPSQFDPVSECCVILFFFLTMDPLQCLKLWVVI